MSEPNSSFQPSSEAAGGFDSFDLAPELRRGITEAGFVQPRPIQVEAIPAGLEGRDILGLAQTGTGKTAAFALPMLERILARPGRGPRALIVAPTRELALQITAEIRTLARFTRIEAITIMGGVSQGKQVTALRKQPEIVVGCPGRLLDLHGQGLLQLDRIETLVLDEADHMFDMGFLPDIRRIVSALPQRRQNLLFSATMPHEIRGLANGILQNPHVVELNHTKPVSTIEHALYPVDSGDKTELLRHLLHEEGFTSAIIFTRTKHRAKRLARQLEQLGAVALQGNMSQNQRERAMQGFRDGRFRILVATDIAARGIDVHNVSHVINYDMPNTVDAYTHRIGRTGRSERDGKGYTFVTPDDRENVVAVERRLGSRIPRRTVDGFVPPQIPETKGTCTKTGVSGTPSRNRNRTNAGNGAGNRSRTNAGNGAGNRSRTNAGNGAGNRSGTSTGSGGGSGAAAATTTEGGSRRRRRRRPRRRSLQQAS